MRVVSLTYYIPYKKFPLIPLDPFIFNFHTLSAAGQSLPLPAAVIFRYLTVSFSLHPRRCGSSLSLSSHAAARLVPPHVFGFKFWFWFLGFDYFFCCHVQWVIYLWICGVFILVTLLISVFCFGLLSW